jgi:hypothetical protein
MKEQTCFQTDSLNSKPERKTKAGPASPSAVNFIFSQKVFGKSHLKKNAGETI